MKLVRLLGAAALTFSLAAPALVYAKTVDLKADLLASTEVPPKDSKGHGELKGTYDTSSKTLKWKVTYSDLTGPASAAHFHGPAPVGQNAGVVIPIPKDGLASPIEGKATLTDQQETDLMAGNWYFNVHTEKNPGGEIRGQVEAAK
jgi:CHRD domain